MTPIEKASRALIANRTRHRTEGNVQSGVEAVLRSLEPGTLESQYQTSAGPADIYLPNRRVFVETKAYPKAKEFGVQQPGREETVLDRLAGYVRAEINRELGMLPLDGDLDVPWRGIVTDGTYWHAWEFPHERDSSPERLESGHFVAEAEANALVSWLADIVGSHAVGVEWVPANPGGLFVDLKADHDDLYHEVPPRAKAALDTKRELWHDMMRASGMVPSDEAGRERLFLAHSFLIAVTRLVSHVLAEDPEDEWQTALRDGFVSWTLDFARGRNWAERVYARVGQYDWRRRRSDVLRELYQHYVPAEDRKVFGEFYTPDCLAALMVEAVCDEDWIERSASAVATGQVPGVGLLDPACGSGTFLYHAALRIVDSQVLADLRLGEKANIAARLLNGIDIHPVAAEIARVNIVRALPRTPTEGDSALNVFVGDSLQIHKRPWFKDSPNMRLTSPKGRTALLPMDFVRDSSFHELMRRMVNAAAKGNTLSGAMMTQWSDHLEDVHAQLTEIITTKGNSVWTWYAVNLAGPHLLAERKVNRIVANPPWVKLSDIQVIERKRSMEDLRDSLGLRGGSAQAPHPDIAQFFVLRARELYAADPDSDAAAWLVKASAMRAGHWELFRQKHRAITQSIDLIDLKPFGSGDATRSCILLEHSKLPDVRWRSVVAKRVTSKSPLPEQTLSTAKRMIEFKRAPKPLLQGQSQYYGRFRQGATITPHVLSLVAKKWSTNRMGWVRVETARSKQR